MIIGMLNNKNLYAFLKEIKPILHGLVAIKIPNEKNSFKTSEIIKVSKQLSIKSFSQLSIKNANEFINKDIKAKKILITGSLYLVGKIRELYL